MKTHLAALRPFRVGPSYLRIPLMMLALLVAPELALVRAQTSAVPGYISYQGSVTDAGGTPVGQATPLNRKIRFRVWSSPTGTTPAELFYSEEQTATISKGEFSVLIGQGTAIASEPTKGKPTVTLDAAAVFSSDTRYLGVSIDDGSGNFTEISPRQQMVTSTYAFRAKYAESVGTGGTNILTVGDSGNIGIGTSPNSSVKLDVAGPIAVSGGSSNGFIFNAASGADGLFSPADNALSLKAGGSDRLYIDTAGRVGIGTTAPGSPLEVVGNIASSGTIASTGYVFKSTGGSDDGLFSPSDNVVTIKTNNTERVRVDSTGNMTVTGNVAASAHTFQSTGGTDDGLFSSADNIVSIKTANIERVKVDGTTGNITVTGNLSTSSNLSASGNLSTSGTLTVTGNVGVGVTGPISPLSFASTLGDKIALWGSSTTANYGFGITNGTLQIHADTSGGDVAFGYGSSSVFYETMRIKGTGNVGIATNSPTKGTLQIGSWVNEFTNPANTAYNHGGSANQAANTATSLSLYAAVDIGARQFIAFSDARIKRVEGRSDAARDLATLQGIEITDYTYIDTVTKGTGKHKKVIAQQVEKVFPQAVSRSTDEVPDIYQRAAIKDGWVSLATDLKKGERVRLIGGKTDGVFEVLEVAKGKFRTSFAGENGQVFVYGREVKDFRSVDYDAISMLNVSATQELKREIDTLRTANAALTQRLAELEAKDKARDERLAAIERRVQAGATVMARPATTANGTGQ